MDFKFTREILDKIKAINERAKFSIFCYKEKNGSDLFLIFDTKDKLDKYSMPRCAQDKLLLSETDLERLVSGHETLNLEISGKERNRHKTMVLITNSFMNNSFYLEHSFAKSLLMFEYLDNATFKSKNQEIKFKKELEQIGRDLFQTYNAKSILKYLGEELYKDYLKKQLKYIAKDYLKINTISYFCATLTLIKENNELVRELIENNREIFNKKSFRVNFISALYAHDSVMGQFAENYLANIYAENVEEISLHKSVQSLEVSNLKIIEKYPLFMKNHAANMYASLTQLIMKKFNDHVVPVLYPNIKEHYTVSSKGRSIMILSASESEAGLVNQSLIKYMDLILNYYQKESEKVETLDFKHEEYLDNLNGLSDKFIEKEKLSTALNNGIIKSKALKI